MRIEFSTRNTILTGIAFAAIAIAMLFCAHIFIDFAGRMGSEAENAALRSVASSTAAAFDPASIESLKGNASDAGTPALQDVRARLKRVHATLPGARFVYLMGARGRTIYFMADAEPRNSPDYSPPGQVYYEDTTRIWQVFKTGQPVIDGPATDRWGIWVSGLAPIADPASGKVVAVLGVDVPWDIWLNTSQRYRLIAFGIVAVIAALAALLAIGFLLYRLARRYLSRLSAEHDIKLGELAVANRIVENSSTILFRIDLSDHQPLTYVSRNIAQYGYDADELLREPLVWLGLFDGDDRPAIQADIQRLASGRSATSRRELRFRRADGTWIWIDGRLTVVFDSSHRRVALEGIMFDITERKHAEERIAHLATHDALTGLVNRPAFLERLQMAFAESKRAGTLFAVHYLDVDHFKDINDAFGHEKGDLLLKAMAERMTNALRVNDTVGRFSIARFGGDEFAILQTGVSEAADAGALAQRLGKMFAHPFDVAGNEIHITVSIGISLYDPSIAEPTDMLMQADLALYRAKDGGRNQFHFHSGNLDTEVRERVAISEDLHAAIEQDQLELHYQPQVEIPSGRIIGMEALIRWNHPVRGMVFPDRFISVAEKTGMIGMLGDWVIRRACRQIGEWRADGLQPPVVGVNVSAIQLQKPEGLLGTVQDAIHQNGIEASALELELTESALVETTANHSDILEQLKGLGLRIAIDDFGTGYSSLQYLHSHPISRIKIAQQFMGEVTGPGSDAAIVRAVIELGRALQLEVIAEGVETVAQAEFLRHAGCHIVQGYYFSPPVPAGEMAGLLRKGTFVYPPGARREHAGAG